MNFFYGTRMISLRKKENDFEFANIDSIEIEIMKT